jgi:hypothetical protein|nr:MAG TPA: Minichromosome maintenance protein MCM [Caudoviricetes sp.]
MAKLHNDLTAMDAADFCKANGTVMRIISTMFRRGWFKVRALLQTLAAYNMSIEDVLDAIDYFEDRGYIQVRDADTRTEMRSCDAQEIDEIEMRLTADGKLLGYKLMADDGIDL